MKAPGISDSRSKIPLRVLIFEDQQEDVEMSLRALEASGYAVTADVVLRLEDFAEQLRGVSYNVILSDYRMPRVSGMDAFVVAKELRPQIPFILVTGSLGEETAIEFLKQGVADYVLKDRLARLPCAVERALEEKRLREERTRAEEALRHSEEELRQRNQELEAQNRRVEAASRMKTEFLANMSHELRSPLNGIIGFSELVYDEKLGPLADTQKECLGRILNSGRHLLRLINDVLDLAKIEAGRFSFQPEPVSISHLVAEVCDSLAALSAEKRIRLKYQIHPQIEAVVDPARFKQILYNYLSNALKFTPENGHVTVRVTPDGCDNFRVEVIDAGPGISKEDMAHLFTDFHQLDSGKAKRFQGAGLGLALTRRLVEAQRGTVGVHSELGKGSTFFAVLPRVAGKAAEHGTDSHC